MELTEYLIYYIILFIIVGDIMYKFKDFKLRFINKLEINLPVIYLIHLIHFCIGYYIVYTLLNK